MKPIVCVESYPWGPGFHWKLTDHGEYVGSGTVYGDGFFSSFNIIPEYRGSGLGGWFLDVMSHGDVPLRRLGACPYNKPTLDLPKLVAFYERHGWKKVYSPQPEIAQYMERT